MDLTAQRQYCHRSPSPSPSNHPIEPNKIYSCLPSDPNIIANSPTTRSRSSQATVYDPLLSPITIADVERLLENARALVSDLSILNGEFASSKSPPSSIAMLQNTPYDLTYLCDFELRVSRLLTKIKKRESATSNADSTTPSDADAEDLRTQLASEHEKLEELYAVYAEMRDEIQGLRCKLESAHKGQYGVYDYELDINYQVIGNQVLPPYYKKPKRGYKRCAATVESSPAPRSTSSTPAPVAKKVKVAKDMGDKAKAKGEKGKEGSGEMGREVKDKNKGKKGDTEDLRAELERMKKERALLAIEVNALKAEKKILQS